MGLRRTYGTGYSQSSSAGGVVHEAADLGDISALLSYKGDRLVHNVEAEKKLVFAFKLRGRKGDLKARKKTLLLKRFKFPVVEKDEGSKKFIMEALSSNVFLSGLSKKQLICAVDAMEFEKISKMSTLITAGDVGDVFYLVHSGQFELKKDGRVIGYANGGDIFGEFALLYETPQDVSVVSTCNSEVWSLDSRVFRQIMAIPSSAYNEIENALRSMPLFKEPEMTADILRSIAAEASFVNFKKGSTIIQKGEIGNIMYFVVSGSVRSTKGTGKDFEFESGDYFGEHSMLSKQPRIANYFAQTDVTCVALYRDTFENHFTEDAKRLLDHNLSVRVLKSVPFVNDLQDGIRDALMDKFVLVEFKGGDVIISPNDAEKILYIVREGEVELRSHTNEVNLVTGDMFGDDVFLKSTKYTYEVVAKGSVRCFALDRSALENIFGTVTDFKDIFTAAYSGSGKRSNVDNLNFGDLEILDTIGTGSFGQVKLVEHKISRTPYALKVLPKGLIIQLHQQTNVINEKLILEKCNHPFIMKFFKSFHDEENIYIMTEVIHGGELYAYLRKYNGSTKKLPLADVRFYAACTVEAISYLHEKHFVYRDLKPENVMIDTKGYLRLVDFGFAKKCVYKTYTKCGTPEYFAPELLKGNGYNGSVDYWSIGVLVYEMIAGRTPFFKEDELQQAQSILENEVSFSDAFPAVEQDFISNLLVKDPKNRLGMLTNGSTDVKNHEWFIGLSWEKLYRKEIKAPFLPKRRLSKKTINDLKVPIPNEYADVEYSLIIQDQINSTDWSKHF